ncbi:MAG: PAC2 family protein [bacterium]
MAMTAEGKPVAPVPVMIAAWPGLGNVGVGAVHYLRKHLCGENCARLDISGQVSPEALEVNQGIGRLAVPEPQLLYSVAEPPLLLFEGSVQPGGEAGIRVAGELLDLARARGVRTVYTGAAFATPTSAHDEVRVYGVATDDHLRAGFGALGVEPLGEGRISGLNGLILGLAAECGLSGACFLATMPQYAVQAPNPKASRALVRVFERILNTTVDSSAIDREVEEVERLLGEFENRVNAAIRNIRLEAAGERPGAEPGSDDDEKPGPEPHEVIGRVEEMFEEAEKDRSKAARLKEALDAWGLFPLYEDRFLDLFTPPRPPTD